MRLQIILNTGNDAFEEYPRQELARILRKAADKVEKGETQSPLLDRNGNSVGSLRITGGEK